MEKRHAGATKTLVRCVRKPTPSTVLENADTQDLTIVPTLRSGPSGRPADASAPSSKASKCVHAKVTKQSLDLRAPMINSSTLLRQQMGDIKENISRKSACSPEEHLTPINEMITKHVNFPQDKVVFKNLIPLNSMKYKGEHPASSRSDTTPLPDKEPNLATYLKRSFKGEYSTKVHTPSAFDKASKSYIGNHHYLWSQKLIE